MEGRTIIKKYSEVDPNGFQTVGELFSLSITWSLITTTPL